MKKIKKTQTHSFSCFHVSWLQHFQPIFGSGLVSLLHLVGLVILSAKKVWFSLPFFQSSVWLGVSESVCEKRLVFRFHLPSLLWLRDLLAARTLWPWQFRFNVTMMITGVNRHQSFYICYVITLFIWMLCDL